MLESNEINMILLDLIKHLEDQGFIEYLEKIEDYEMLENFCEGISIRIIEYTTNKRKKKLNGNQDHI